MMPISAFTKDAWLSGDYVGPRRPMMRATIQRLDVQLFPYTLEASQITTPKAVNHFGVFSTVPFGQMHQPLELPNLASVSWQRGDDKPVASCTLTFYNTDPMPIGMVPASPDEFDQPGYFTFNRGATGYSTRWGYKNNGWRDMLVPDRVIRTYQGYGFDPNVDPMDDPHMYPSGVWIVDEVQYTTDGMISVACRDIGRVLIDQIAFPPVVPWAEYPLKFEAYHEVANPPILVTSDSWVRPTWETDSNQPYRGAGITDGGMAYVQPDGSCYGHHGRDAFDSSDKTYFLSVGNLPTWSSAYEYVQGSLGAGRTIGAVKVKVKGGPYHGYVSVKVGSKWQGSKKIPYKSRQIDSDADIPFVKTFDVKKDGTVTIKLPKYEGATSVRITLTNLWNSGLGKKYKYRAAIADIQVSAEVKSEADGGTHTEGNYADYTDLVKWFLAWAGFYWPKAGSSSASFMTKTDGTREYVMPASDDPLFPGGGRVWGDIQTTGTYGPAALTVDVWDKKPLLDCITFVRDIVNFVFWIDETGGAIWRQPNIWSVGNYVTPLMGGPSIGRTSEIHEIDERLTLMELTAKLSSRNTRERVFVGNIAGNLGAVAAGFNPYPSGLRRVSGWTDQRFQSVEECQRMADLITVRQMFTYREDQIQIPGNPAIQIDDQVRIFERVSNEGFIHYVKGIDCSWSLETGEWIYTLTTHWLGESPFDRWTFDPAELSEETQQYLRGLGLIA